MKKVRENDERDRWYFRVRQMKDAYEINFDPDSANENELAAFVNYRVVDLSGRYLGAIGIGLSIESMTSLLVKNSKTYSRVVYFVDSEGSIKLGTPRHEGVTNLNQIAGLVDHHEQILSASTSNSFLYENKGHTAFLNSRYFVTCPKTDQWLSAKTGVFRHA